MTTLHPIPHHLRATDEDIIDEIFRLLWFEFGAQLGDFEFYARHVTRLQEAYGCEAVAAALQRRHRQMRRATAFQIQQQPAFAKQLKRQAGRE
jgi:hypothetical protein